MFRMGTGEWLVVAFVAMLFMGPKQVKMLLAKMKETMSILKEEVDDFDSSRRQ